MTSAIPTYSARSSAFAVMFKSMVGWAQLAETREVIV
jgi:hypothetical protein